MKDETQVQEQPATTTVGKPKKKAVGANLLIDIASEVEGLTKPKALHLADALAVQIDQDYFKMGGVLRLIHDNSWFEGFEDFDQFVMNKYGFQGRKARYLMGIYTELVTKQIEWSKVSILGWTKLKDLAPVLTIENTDEWVAKVKDLTYLEMMAVLKSTNGSSEASSKTKSDSHPFKVALKEDQMEIVQSALAKAKGEIGTDYDSVALENICAGYVGGVVGGAPTGAIVNGSTDLESLFKSVGWEAVLTAFGEVFPDINITVDEPA
jgi:hypothetical protein